MSYLPVLIQQRKLAYAIIMLDSEGIIREWLGGSQEIFGYAAEEVVGKAHRVLFTPEDVAIDIPRLELSIAASQTESEDDRWMLKKDGSRFWASGVVSPVFENGRLVAFGKILRNLTDFRGRLDSALRQLEAERAKSERKNLFISTLAHELRNPMHSISMALGLLERLGARGEETDFAHALVKRQVDFMKRMVEDLLESTRLGAGKVALVKERLDLRTVVCEAVDTCRAHIAERRQKIAVHFPETSMLAEGDPARLQQVFVNLIQNASKYTEPEGHIWVKGYVDAEDNIVAVQDSGIGIAPEIMPRIFELFVQARSEAARDHEGLGIGLSVVKELVELHDGLVVVKSDGIGKGSEFTVRLPKRTEDASRGERREG